MSTHLQEQSWIQNEIEITLLLKPSQLHASMKQLESLHKQIKLLTEF